MRFVRCIVPLFVGFRRLMPCSRGRPDAVQAAAEGGRGDP